MKKDKQIKLHATKVLTTITHLILCFVFFVSGNLQAQKVKTYSGNYKLNSSSSEFNPDLYKGNSTYSYYENEDHERIYHGKFKYSGDLEGNGIKVKISISGNYKNHLKNGLFTNTLNVKMPRQATQNIICKSNFSNGYADGLWSLKAMDESISVRFLNNIGTGSFNYKSGDLSIKGRMDQDGYLDGTVIFTGDNWETKIDYNHGFMLKYIERNTQTGEITDKDIADPILVENYNKIQEALESGDSSELENIPFRVVNSFHSGILEKYNEQFKNFAFPGSLPGDLTETQDYRHNFIWQAFLTKNLEAQETKSERLEREEKVQKEIERLAEIERLKAERIIFNKKIITEFENNEKRVTDVYVITYQKRGVDAYKIEKKIIYRSYTELYDHYVKKAIESSENSVKEAILDKIIALSDHVIGLSKIKTKDIRKLLKAADNLEEIEQILK